MSRQPRDMKRGRQHQSQGARPHFNEADNENHEKRKCGSLHKPSGDKAHGAFLQSGTLFLANSVAFLTECKKVVELPVSMSHSEVTAGNRGEFQIEKPVG